ncbi:MAG: sulfurtransferase complex subunit TusD [Gammaproteobacteria bacterium]|nr:sulfurtransferase complex subunit TusD [Gammaproteobacteria bacterium]
MKISLLVQGAPHSSTACEQALNFARAVIRKNHTLFRVFFYKDAVSIANSTYQLPSDEWNIQEAWLDFANENNMELMVCIGAAQRRGISEASLPTDGRSGFQIVGLGQFIEATIESDRVVTFN